MLAPLVLIEFLRLLDVGVNWGFLSTHSAYRLFFQADLTFIAVGAVLILFSMTKSTPKVKVTAVSLYAAYGIILTVIDPDFPHFVTKPLEFASMEIPATLLFTAGLAAVVGLLALVWRAYLGSWAKEQHGSGFSQTTDRVLLTTKINPVLRLAGLGLMAVSAGVHVSAALFYVEGRLTLFSFGILYLIVALLFAGERRIFYIPAIVAPSLGAAVGLAFFPLTALNLFFLSIEFAVIFFAVNILRSPPTEGTKS